MSYSVLQILKQIGWQSEVALNDGTQWYLVFHVSSWIRWALCLGKRVFAVPVECWRVIATHVSRQSCAVLVTGTPHTGLLLGTWFSKVMNKSWQYRHSNSTRNIVGLTCPKALHLRSQLTKDWTYSKATFQEVPKSMSWICCTPTTTLSPYRLSGA